MQSRSPLSITKSKVQSAGVVEIQSPCFHGIVSIAASDRELFFSVVLSPARDRDDRPSD